MTLVLAIHFLGERSGPIRLAGMGLAFAGVLVLVGLAGDGEVGVENRLGMAVLVLAPVTWACYNVIGKPLFIAVAAESATWHSCPALSMAMSIPSAATVAKHPVR